MVLSFIFPSTSVVESSSSIYARNYIVMDAYTQEVLEGKDIHSSYSVASISKIMTAIIALESDRLFQVITVDDVIKTVEGSSIYLSIGDQISILDLVYGLLLRSGNDAAVLIAKNVAKDIDSFVVLMNQKAKSIGMKNTIFHNPSGLDIFDEGNISSCYDMGLLMAYCMNNELFAQIVGTKSYVSPLKGQWNNKNKLLKLYKYCIGGKTGFTAKARRTLVTVSEKEHHRLIVVTLNCGGDFSFHQQLYEKYYNTYNYVVFFLKGKNYIDEYCFDSKQTIGIRLDKKMELKGIKKYFIHPYSHEIEISVLLKDGTEIYGGKYKNVSLMQS